MGCFISCAINFTLELLQFNKKNFNARIKALLSTDFYPYDKIKIRIKIKLDRKLKLKIFLVSWLFLMNSFKEANGNSNTDIPEICN